MAAVTHLNKGNRYTSRLSRTEQACRIQVSIKATGLLERKFIAQWTAHLVKIWLLDWELLLPQLSLVMCLSWCPLLPMLIYPIFTVSVL